MPVIPGIKSEKEKFAGGLYTTTVEGFIPASGRGIQGGTSHSLGQNFSKMFNITVEDPEKPGKDNKLFVWQNSWGLSTRTIGVMVMTHSDDKGLVLPPKVAQWQFVVIPTGISAKTTAEQRQSLYDKAQEVASTLIDGGLRAKADLREGYTPGWKYNEWEMRVGALFFLGTKLTFLLGYTCPPRSRSKRSGERPSYSCSKSDRCQSSFTSSRHCQECLVTFRRNPG